MQTVSALRAAEAALNVHNGVADSIAIALLYVPGEQVLRSILHSDGRYEGTVGTGDGVALRTARSLLGLDGRGGGAEERGSGGAEGTAGSGTAGTAGTAGVAGSGLGSGAPAARVDVGGREGILYVEVHHPPEQLVVVGAGHIAVPLAHLGVLLGFRTTVLDDREDMATAERFDDEVRVLRTDFATDPFAGVTLNARSYIALVTRGHRWDFDCLQRVLALPVTPRYIGMIGSRRRVRAAFHALEQGGVSRDVLATIRAPIGLELGAETPEEIAVAIAAEIVGARRGREL